MSTTSLAQLPRLFNCAILLSAEEDDVDEDGAPREHRDGSAASTDTSRSPTMVAGASRLYFTGSGTTAKLTSLQRFLKVEEAHRTCPLLRVLQLAPQAPTNNAQPLVYVEHDRASASATFFDEAEAPHTEAVLTTCTSVCTQDAVPAGWFAGPVEAAVSVFQDFMAPRNATPFWRFLTGVVRHHAQHFRSGAVLVELQGVLVPTFEAEEDTVYSVDLFDDFLQDSEADRGDGGAAEERRTAAKVRVTSMDDLHRVMAYLRQHWPRLEQDFGSSHLIVYARWYTVAGGDQHAPTPTPPPPAAAEQTACLVWLQNDAVAGGRDGVYADAALEALLDELTLAAASISTPSEAASVLQEAGVSAFCEECGLTHTLRKVLRKHFPAVVLRRRPLFHWVLSLPAHHRLRTSRHDTDVTAVRFRPDAAVSRAMWSATEMLVHWQLLCDAAHVAGREALQRRFGSAGRSPRQVLSAPPRVHGPPPRVPRQRRAVQQSGQGLQSLSGGSALDRQRGKVNVSHLYGVEEGRSEEGSRRSTPRESLLAASGLFHSLRSASEDAANHSALLAAEETFGSYPKLTTRAVQRITRVRSTTHSAQ